MYFQIKVTIKNYTMTKIIEETLKPFRKEDMLRMILEMKTLMIRYLGEGDMSNSDMLYEASLLLDALHEHLLESILEKIHRI